MNKNNKLIQSLAILLLILAIILPRALSIGQYTTPDEPLWLRRSANFYYALGQRDWAQTFQREHPGVTTMWAGVLGYAVSFPEYRGLGQGYFDSSIKQERFLVENGHTALEVLIAGRAFMVAFASIALLLSFWLAWRLLGFWPAWVGMLFVALEPFTIALTKVLHVDGLLGSFMLLSSLAYMYYLKQRGTEQRAWIYLILSAVAGGLALLTKSPGVFMLPFIGLMTLLDVFRGWREDKDWKQAGMALIKPVTWWTAIFALAFIAFWPAAWVSPLEMVSAVFGKATAYAEQGHTSPTYFMGELSRGGGFGLLFYPVTYLWRITPATYFGLLLAMAGNALKWQEWKTDKVKHQFIVDTALFALLFIIFLNLSDKRFDRYLLPMYPILSLLAGLGWFGAGRHAARKLKRGWLTWAGVMLAILFQLGSVFQTAPYYLSHYNPLLGGNARAPEVMQIGWGEGLDAAARYLNTLPDAENSSAMAWYHIGPFSYYYDGTTTLHSLNGNWKEESVQMMRESDYLVVYIHQWQRDLPHALLEKLVDVEPMEIITVEGIDYVNIYRVDELPEDVFTLD